MALQEKELIETIKAEMSFRDKIISALRERALTVPEVAEQLGQPASQVMYWMMALRKYGVIEETEEVTDEGYYKYKLVAK
ncbi:MarR family transcriptional regulator [Candidatus Aminicenantes bacterium AC-334-K16]|jgi:predicted Rossmann fold nucleotide-binding protein DprA/Smf involved in DNA uptake|nr:MarR family transcriptional regulator [Candidatus Aminicenantes bacterium AC-334-K16]